MARKEATFTSRDRPNDVLAFRSFLDERLAGCETIEGEAPLRAIREGLDDDLERRISDLAERSSRVDDRLADGLELSLVRLR